MALRQRRQTREMPSLSLRASVAPETLNEEKRTVEVVWTTGARVLRGGWEQYYEELSLDPKHVRMERLQGHAPVLDTHSGFQLRDVIGVVESARLESGKGTAVIRFDRGPEGSAAWAKVKDGILRNISVGYRVYRMEKVEDGDGKIPVFRATSWEPVELSVVPINADPGAAVRSGEERNPCEFIEERKMKLKAKKNPQGEEPTKIRAEEEAEDTEADEERAEDDDEEKDDEAADDDEADDDEEEERSLPPPATARAVRAERLRIVDIQRAGKVLKVPADVVAHHVAKGTKPDAFRKLAIEHHRKTARIDTGVGGPRIEPGEDAREKWLRGAQSWILIRSTTDRVVAEHARKSGENVKFDPGEFRGMSLVDLARSSLERQGVRTAGLSKLDLVGKALTHRAGGYQSTSDFPVLLEGTLNRVLLAAYATAPDTWRMFAAKGSVPDFRAVSRIRTGTFSRLDKVNESGEFRNKPIPDGASESIAAETYGNIIALTRQAIINDDLGAFSSLAMRLGRAAKLSIEVDVYALLAENAGLGPTMSDGDTLFHANHNNISGTGSTIGVAALDADRVVMATQLDQEGNEYLDIRPKVLLVPIGLEGTARVLVEAEYDVDAGDATTPNRIRGMFPTIVGSPRISGTRRYLFADPNDLPTLEVVFLDGNENPYLESQEGWRIDGTEWKVRLDYGVGAVDFRGAVTNDGTP